MVNYRSLTWLQEKTPRRALAVTAACLLLALCAWSGYLRNLATTLLQGGVLLALCALLLGYWARRNPEAMGGAAAHIAGRDQLTGAFNFRHFSDNLSCALQECRNTGKRLAVLVIDLDRFNIINNTVGSATGDKLLAEVAARIMKCLESRPGCSIARRAGDEFLAQFGISEDPQELPAAVAELAKVFQRPFQIGGQDLFVSASIGIAVFPVDGSDGEALVRNAELAMCKTKEHGRNGFEFYAPSMTGEVQAKHDLDNSLRRALEAQEFVLYYQPKVDAGSNRIVGAEALIRWRHPSRGIVGPDHFIPAAEETGLIIAIGEWVLRAACVQNKAWQDEGLAWMRVAVNFSPVQFLQQQLVATVEQVLAETGLDPHYLEIEVTESIMFQDFTKTEQALSKLAAMGIHISIDDFGTGYSSFASLKRLPFHSLKIDKSFVRDIVTNHSDATIATTIIAMAGSLRLDVIAEGVEDREQFEFLRDNNCNAMQGYYFSKPVPAGEFAALLRRGGAAPAESRR